MAALLMRSPWKNYLVIFISCFTSVSSIQLIDNHSLEENINEYFLEHEVSQWEATTAARSLIINDDPPPGCKPCTSEQLLYCFGNGLLRDHCCCDKRYEETLPFIPHSCYSSAKPCTLHASNCGEYLRLKRCCCDAPLKRRWKARSSSSTRMISTSLWISSLALSYIMVHFFR